MGRGFILQGLFAAVLSGIAGIIYNTVYSKAMYADFSKVLNVGGILGACVFACTLIALGHFLVFRWKAHKLLGAYNLLVCLLSFASIIGVLGFTLPLDIESPELFAGLAIPMHFFPALAYFSLEPFFRR